MDHDPRHARDRLGDDVLEARVGRRRHRHGVAVAAEPGRHPDDVRGDRLGLRAGPVRTRSASPSPFASLSLVAQQIRGSGSPDEQVHHPPPPNAVSTSTIPGGSVFTSPISAACSQPGDRAQRGRAPRPPPRARRRRRACPRWPRTSGRCRGSPPRRRPPGCTGTSASRTTIATPEARASSLSTEATPPRVASRMQRSAGPAASSSASTAGHSERVSDSIVGVELELAAGQHDRRAVLADRARDEDPVARPQRVGRRAGARVDVGRARSCRRTSRRRGRARPPWCRRRRSRTPAAAGRRARSPRPRRAGRRRRGPPRAPATSVSASGRAPATARSLTVPLTASSPIEPPGKRIGLTTKLSVVSASPAPSIATAPASPSARQRVGRRRPGRAGPRSASGSPCRRRRGPS